MFVNLYIARHTYHFILIYTCGLTVVIKRIRYVMLCYRATVSTNAATVERFHRDVDLSVGVVEKAVAEPGDGHEQARGALHDDLTQLQRELGRVGVGNEAPVDDDVELSINGDAERRRRVVDVAHVDHDRFDARHGRVRQALGRLVRDLEVSA